MSNKYSTFKREFEIPILKSRQPGAATSDLEKGEARSEALAEITGQFILRRTSGVLSSYLPPKTEFVVFCRPSAMQKDIYREMVRSPAFLSGIESPGNVLELINALKLVCNAPQLLCKDGEIKRPDLTAGISPRLIKTPGISGKLRVLDDLLVQIYSSTEEKVVLVSNYTSTLDLLATFISSLGYSHLRLDGNTPPTKRQGLVDRFNRSPKSNSFVFLLSAKAGGVGINLIGASRLILFDCDWNPAVDLQAMARVHRDGQKRECFIYRMITQGTLDEKIFQRQVSKMGLADSIVDGKSAASGFTQQELRDLFTLDEGEGCQTHRLLGCGCGGSGLQVGEKEDPIRNDLAALSRDVKKDAGDHGKALEKEIPYCSGMIKKQRSSEGGDKNIRKAGQDDENDQCFVIDSEAVDHDHFKEKTKSDEDVKEQPEDSEDENVKVEPERGEDLQEGQEDSEDEFVVSEPEDDEDPEDSGNKDLTFDSEDDDEVFIPKKFNKLGSAADVAALDAIERRPKECRDSAGNAKFLSLMRYTHFDTSKVSKSEGRLPSTIDEDSNDLSELDTLDLAIEDKVLRSVIRKDGRRIGFVLTKMGHNDQ